MTKHTAEEWAGAEFGRHEDGRIAARLEPEGTYPWEVRTRCYTDTEMAADPGWSIVRDAEDLTAREHLEKAWEKAHEVDVIPAGVGYITKWVDGDFGTALEGSRQEMPSRALAFERRLLDPPPAPAWHNARIIEVDGCQWARREDSDRGVEWVALSGIPVLRTTAEITKFGDVDVIIGADEHTEGQDR